MASVLEGVKVLDLSSGIAGPVAGMLLADHGADVVKVEPPGGDPLRGTAGYDAWLRGRRSAELDLKDAGDRATFLALAADADVVLEIVLAGHHESTRHRRRHLARRQPAAGVLLDHRRTARTRRTATAPATTPWSPPASAAARAARSSRRRGAAHERRRAVPAGPGDPRRHGTRVAPLGTDLHLHAVARAWPTAFLAAVGINAALLARERTGRGQHVETSLLQAAFSLTASKWQRAEHNDAARLPHLDLRPARAEGHLPCSDDRWVQQWVPNPAFVLSSADGDTLALRRRRRPGPRRPRPRPARPGEHHRPRALLPGDGRGVRTLPERRVGRGRRDRPACRSSRCARPRRRSCDPTLEAEGAVVDVPTPRARLAPPGRHRLRAERDSGTGPGAGARRRRAHRGGPRRARRRRRPAPRRAASRPRRTTPDRPLDGITVLDLGFAVAGPFGTQVLADLGANVIKVNAAATRGGTPTTSPTAPTAASAASASTSRPPTVSPCSTGSSSRPTSCTPTCAATRCGGCKCDEESLRAVNPDIIYCHTRGFDRGPALATRPATTRPAARSPASPTRTAAATTAADRSGASPHSATPATGSCPPSA